MSKKETRFRIVYSAPGFKKPANAIVKFDYELRPEDLAHANAIRSRPFLETECGQFIATEYIISFSKVT